MRGGRFVFDLRMFLLEEEWLSFYIKPEDGLQLPAIMRRLKQTFPVRFNLCVGKKLGRVVRPVPALSVIPALRYAGSHLIASTGDAKLNACFPVSFKAVGLNRRFTVSAAVDNLFDELHEIRPCFPSLAAATTSPPTAKGVRKQ
jgi:hypothetical protein